MYMFCNDCGCVSHSGDLVCPECGAAMTVTGEFEPTNEAVNWGDVCLTVGVFALLSSVMLTGIWGVCHIVEKVGAGALLNMMQGGV